MGTNNCIVFPNLSCVNNRDLRASSSRKGSAAGDKSKGKSEKEYVDLDISRCMESEVANRQLLTSLEMFN